MASASLPIETHLEPVTSTEIPKPTAPALFGPPVTFIETEAAPPFLEIRHLFDHLRANASDAAKIYNTYPSLGIFKNAAASNGLSDLKFTIDLSPHRLSKITGDLRTSLAAHGFEEAIALIFFLHKQQSYKRKSHQSSQS